MCIKKIVFSKFSILFFALTQASVLFAQTESKQTANLLPNFKLALGNYETKKDVEGCLSGELSYPNQDNATHLKLGTRLVAQFIDKESHSETEGDCKYTFQNKISENSLVHTQIEQCEGSPLVRRETTVNKTPDGFNYFVKVRTANNPPVQTIACELVKK